LAQVMRAAVALAALAAAWSPFAELGRLSKSETSAAHPRRHHRHGAFLSHTARVLTPVEYLRTEVDRLHKARDDLGARRDANKARYDDDVKEIDRLVEEQHHIQESDVQEEVSGIESEMSVLRSEAKIYAKNGDQAKSDSVEGEVKGLETVLEQLQSNATDGPELIKKITKEGELFYQAAQAQSAGVELLDHELKGLDRKLMDAEEREDGDAGGGMLDSMDDGDEEDSARGLEAALGKNWQQDDLEAKATEAENALNHAISHKPVMGEMMGMMGALR